jgi:parallel beta-helix repeat protein
MRGKVSLLLGSLLMISSIISLGTCMFSGMPRQNQTGLPAGELGCSVIHPKISIASNNDLVSFPNKTGSGIPGAPYIIENMEIDAGGVGSSIYIRNTNLDLVIRNCTLTGVTAYGAAGIYLENCTRVHIINCTSNGNYYGYAFSSYCQDIAISNCTASGNIRYGISATGDWPSYNNRFTVTSNVANGNGEYGIIVWGDYFNVSMNNASNNGLDGFWIVGDYGHARGNIAIQNGNGFKIRCMMGSFIDNYAANNNICGFNIDASNFNTFTGNNASLNTLDGFYLHYATRNTMTANLAMSNGRYGIAFNYSNSNTASSNTARGNGAGTIIQLNSVSNAFYDNDCDGTCNNKSPENALLTLAMTISLVVIIPITTIAILYKLTSLHSRREETPKTPQNSEAQKK